MAAPTSLTPTHNGERDNDPVGEKLTRAPVSVIKITEDDLMSHRDEPATKRDLQEVKQELALVKQELTAKIDANATKIESNATKIEENGRKIEANAAKIEENGRKIEANGRKIAANAAKIDDVEKRLTAKIEENGRKIEKNAAAISRLTAKVVENGMRLDQMVTRDEFNKRMDEIIAGQDRLSAIFTQLDQERIAVNSRLDRVEADVATNKKDIKKIKTKLAMP